MINSNKNVLESSSPLVLNQVRLSIKINLKYIQTILRLCGGSYNTKKLSHDKDSFLFRNLGIVKAKDFWK